MKIFYLLAVSAALVLVSCKSDSPLAPENNNNSYSKILTAESGNKKVEIYSATANRLVTGFNDIGFKFYIDNQAKTDGFLKFQPKMYHVNTGGMHSSPVSPSFYYSQDKEFYTGYSSFLMISDSNAHWFGFVNYNNSASVDSFSFVVDTASTCQVRYFEDLTMGHSYYLTLASPFNPRQAPNVLRCLLHMTDDNINYTQVDSAQMFIRPWMEAMGHGSSNNVNPAYVGGGVYEGQANFTMSGIWYVYDSIRVQNRFITPTPPPRFIFDVP